MAIRGLRVLAVVPTLFAVVGADIITFTWLLRHLWSPLPGFMVGGAIVVASALAVIDLWRQRTRAPVVLVVNGALTLVSLLIVHRLFPLVNASSEPPPPLAWLWYPSALVGVVVLTIASAWIARGRLRRIG